jgi:hypothetical protein
MAEGADLGVGEELEPAEAPLALTSSDEPLRAMRPFVCPYAATWQCAQ